MADTNENTTRVYYALYGQTNEAYCERPTNVEKIREAERIAHSLNKSADVPLLTAVTLYVS